MKTQFVLLFMAACAGGGSQLFAADTPPAGADIVACKVIQTVKPVYPVRLMNDGITKGEARVVLQVDSTGQLTDTLVTAYTHKAFADEAVYAIQQWKFQPASVDGEPAGGIVEVTFDYAIDRMLIIQRFNNLQEEPSLEAGQYQYHTATLKQLDRIPTPTSILSPVYPKEWARQGIKGSVTVEFYIDETGHTRMPAIIAGDNHLLEGSAIQAVSQWRFEPPTQGGKPALVRAQQVFKFGSN